MVATSTWTAVHAPSAAHRDVVDVVPARSFDGDGEPAILVDARPDRRRRRRAVSLALAPRAGRLVSDASSPRWQRPDRAQAHGIRLIRSATNASWKKCCEADTCWAASGLATSSLAAPADGRRSRDVAAVLREMAATGREPTTGLSARVPRKHLNVRVRKHPVADVPEIQRRSRASMPLAGRGGCSLLPGEPLLHERESGVRAGLGRGNRRMTLA